MTEDDIFFGHLDCLELSSKAPFFFFFFFFFFFQVMELLTSILLKDKTTSAQFTVAS